MIRVGDIVTISPAHSLLGGRKGKVVHINFEDTSPISIRLIKNNELGKFTFGFSPNELIKEENNENN